MVRIILGDLRKNDRRFLLLNKKINTFYKAKITWDVKDKNLILSLYEKCLDNCSDYMTFGTHEKIMSEFPKYFTNGVYRRNNHCFDIESLVYLIKLKISNICDYRTICLYILNNILDPWDRTNMAILHTEETISIEKIINSCKIKKLCDCTRYFYK